MERKKIHRKKDYKKNCWNIGRYYQFKIDCNVANRNEPKTKMLSLLKHE